jgi:hypothetical protein
VRVALQLFIRDQPRCTLNLSKKFGARVFGTGGESDPLSAERRLFDPHGRTIGSGGAVDRDLKGCANGAHPNVGKSAKPADQDCDGHTFHGVQVHGRTAGDRVGIGFEYNLAG